MQLRDFLAIYFCTGIGVWFGYFICPKIEKWLVRKLSKFRNNNNQ